MNKIFNREARTANSQICHSNVISYGPSTHPLLQQGWSHLTVPWTQVHKYLSDYIQAISSTGNVFHSPWLFQIASFSPIQLSCPLEFFSHLFEFCFNINYIQLYTSMPVGRLLTVTYVWFFFPSWYVRELHFPGPITEGRAIRLVLVIGLYMEMKCLTSWMGHLIAHVKPFLTLKIDNVPDSSLDLPSAWVSKER